MLVQFEDPTIIKPQPLPNRVAPLHCRIERTDPGLVAMNELTVDVDRQVLVFGIRFLEHVQPRITRISQIPRKKKSHPIYPCYPWFSEVCAGRVSHNNRGYARRYRAVNQALR